jgi:hypothetical protein
MTAPQLTFLLTTVVLSLTLTGLFYKGVVRYAPSKRESLLAASMAGLLCATPLGWITAAIINLFGSR